MPTKTLPSFYLPQFLTDAGDIAAGYWLYTYASGTTTPLATYADANGVSTNANPIILDSAGRAVIFLTPATQYTFVLRTPGGALIWTRDSIEGLPEASATAYLPLAGGTMTGLVTLSGNATALLNPVPLQQVTSLIGSTVKTAATVSIADAGNYYTGTTVEAALQEIGAFPGRLLRTVYFTSSGTWTKGTGTTRVLVELVGAGAGTRNSAVAQGGGGAGGYSRRLITSPGASETVTIGAGAAATAGGTTSFGAWCSASGGSLSSGTSNAIGGLGGVGAGGDLNLTGGAGGFGATLSNPAETMGHGGNSYFGGGAPGTIMGFGSNTNNGAANTGGGGSGQNAAGGSGLCVVYEFS